MSDFDATELPSRKRADLEAERIRQKFNIQKLPEPQKLEGGARFRLVSPVPGVEAEEISMAGLLDVLGIKTSQALSEFHTWLREAQLNRSNAFLIGDLRVEITDPGTWKVRARTWGRLNFWEPGKDPTAQAEMVPSLTREPKLFKWASLFRELYPFNINRRGAFRWRKQVEEKMRLNPQSPEGWSSDCVLVWEGTPRQSELLKISVTLLP